ncbi:MAG: hypothetical protein QGG40_19640 [Myxococcota bacterium]|nr:hypothetical protein [Myxococcota bacterium]
MVASLIRALVISTALLVGFSRPAIALTSIEEAELVRLSGELRSLAGRSAWTGVERIYTEMESFGEGLTFRDYVHGAEAARALGDIESSYTRFIEAAKIGEARDVVDSLWNYDQQYGRVVLQAHRRSSLTSQEPPLDPVMRASIGRALEVVSEKGEFAGILPAGIYELDGEVFEVVPGKTLAVNVKRRSRLMFW